MAKRTLTRSMVLEELKRNKSPKEIADSHKVSVNSIYAHIRRLKKDGDWKEKTKAVGEVDYDKLMDVFITRLENNLNISQKNQVLEKENYDLRNKLKMAENELLIVKDELKGKPEMQERVRRIAKAINIEQTKLSHEAST